ncbi:hypothetical protein, partial [Burkholderia gladioli]|uniref:hypothetical protein n=1 Tax=Burkholderia gladioli TaxID=28095 RepID=UPI003F798609
LATLTGAAARRCTVFARRRCVIRVREREEGAENGRGQGWAGFGSSRSDAMASCGRGEKQARPLFILV